MVRFIFWETILKICLITYFEKHRKYKKYKKHNLKNDKINFKKTIK